MKKSRILSIILASLILSSSFIGCSNTSPDNNEKESSSDAAESFGSEESAETVEVDPETVDSLPSGLSFGGEDFVMISSWLSNNSEYCSLTEEGLTGDVLNDAKFYMEASTSDRLDVNISEIQYDLWDLRAHINNLVQAGDDTYSCVNQWDSHAVTCAAMGLCLPLENVEYIDLTKKYWGDVLSESLAIGGKNYFAIGSYNLAIYERIACIFMNTQLADEYQLEIPFEDVYNGTWTLDKLSSYAGIATNDMNGDGTMDLEDRFTYGTSDRRPIAHQIWIGSGLKVIEKDENDTPYITIFGSEKFHDILAYTKEMFFDGNDILSYTAFECGPTSEVWDKGNELIHFAQFKTNIGMRDIDISYAILPIPKYDENQQQYFSHTYQGSATYVPSNVKDTALAGAVIEALCAYGYNNVVPAYVESTLQDKIAQDPTSKEMIQIIFDTRTIDLGETLLFDQFGDSEIYSLMQRSSNVISSWLTKMSKPSENALQRIIDKLN